MPVLRAPYFEQEVLGPRDARSARRRALRRPTRAPYCTTGSRRSWRSNGGAAELRLDLPFESKGDVALRKIGLELVVRVDGHKRTIVLPGALAGFKPTSREARRGLAGGGVRGWLSPTAQYEEAERLVREAQRAAEEAAGRPRRAAARLERARRGAGAGSFPDLGAAGRADRVAAGRVPPELARQLADALRELLIAVRAVLDWYIARLEPSEPRADVEDIPVE